MSAMRTIETDVVILGAGTAGLNARRAVAAADKRWVLVEGAVYGTMCARVGCMPSKLLIEAADAYYYPDVMVSCDPADRRAELAITAPSLIAEVLSDSTASRDRGLKFTHYRLIPSLRDYLIIDPEHRRIELYSRAEQGWLLREAGLGVAPPTAELPLDSLGLRLRCDDVFADLPELTTPPPFESDEPRDELAR